MIRGLMKSSAVLRANRRSSIATTASCGTNPQSAAIALYRAALRPPLLCKPSSPPKEPALCGSFFLDCLDMLATIAIEDVNVWHPFQINVADKLHCRLAAGALHLTKSSVYFGWSHCSVHRLRTEWCGWCESLFRQTRQLIGRIRIRVPRSAFIHSPPFRCLHGNGAIIPLPVPTIRRCRNGRQRENFRRNKA